jgi:hypothetical protein
MFDILCILPWFTGNIRINFQANKLNAACKMEMNISRMRNNYFTGCRNLKCCAGGFSFYYTCNIIVTYLE